jgi:hypothetical protein
MVNRISTLLQFFPALVLTGARQTGKTTLLQESFPHYRYVSLDLPSVAVSAEESPERFFSENPPPCIIDEIQYAPLLFRHLKAEIDKNRHAMGSWILTGSQKFTLMKNVADSLAGRAAILELEGLSKREIASTGTAATTEQFIQRGGFPELWRVPELPTVSFFSSYLASYLERDVRQILNVGSLRDFERFVRVLAARNAAELDLTAVGNAVGVTAKTSAAWLSVLETSNQIALLEPWHANIGKRIVKRPKVYFRDTGFLCWLLGISPPLPSQGPWNGALWETYVFAELRKAIETSGKNRALYYYRDNGGIEVDFVVAGDGSRLIETKWTELPRPADAIGIRKLAAIGRKTRAAELWDARGFVLCRTRNDYPIVDPADQTEDSVRVEAIGMESMERMLDL